MRLFTPGPVPVPDDVSAAVCAPMIHHHSDEFRSLVTEIRCDLQKIFRTDGSVAVLTGSAMSGMESVAAACIRPGDRVMVLCHGRFGERLADLCRILRADVITVDGEWGSGISTDVFEQALRQALKSGPLRAVWLVHSETSTGVLLDLASLSSVLRVESPETLLLVDAVTSLAIQQLETDAWQLDAVVSGIQKGLCCPPGLAVVAMSDRFERIVRSSDDRLYSHDLRRVLIEHDSARMLWTPPVGIVRGLHAAVRTLLGKGLDTIWQEHADRHSFVCKEARLRGLTIFGEGSSQALVALMHPKIETIRQRLLEKHGMMVANGQDRLAGTMMRIGICGSYTLSDMIDLFAALDDVMAQEGRA